MDTGWTRTWAAAEASNLPDVERAFHQVSDSEECTLHLNHLEADAKLVLLEIDCGQ